MTNLFTWLFAAVGPLVVQALVSIGFAAVSFAGVQTAFTALISYAQSSWTGLPIAVLQLASLAGVPGALGLVFGAMTGRMAVWGLMNGAKLLFKGK